VAAPTAAELQKLMQRISERVGRQLERKGWLVRDEENTYLDGHLALEPDEEEASLKDLQGHSITYRIALGPHKGRCPFYPRQVRRRCAAHIKDTENHNVAAKNGIRYKKVS
jgi:hypothetical protein